MKSEPTNLQELGQYSGMHEAWEKCMTILDTEKPDEGQVFEWIKNFKSAQRFGEKYLANHPKDSFTKELVHAIHVSLSGLDDSDKDQKALFNFWFGLNFYLEAQKPEWDKNSKIEFLEQQTIPAYNRALQLAPDYPEAIKQISIAKNMLSRLQNNQNSSINSVKAQGERKKKKIWEFWK
jgi:hypothetical protein